MATLSLLSSLFDRTGFAQHDMARFWSKIVLRLGFVRCKVYGIDRLDPRMSYVFVSNHASYMDTPAILSSVPMQFRFFAKIGLFQIPFLGWHLRHAGHIPVVRDDPRASLKTMIDSAKIIRERKVSLLLFPEGGRTPEGMGPFKEGAAFIAIKAGVPAVPIGLVGTREVLPMHSLVIRPGTVEVHVGDPIETSNMTSQDRGRLSDMLRERVEQLVSTT